MARIYGSNRVIGTVGGLRHYKLRNDDVIYVAEKGGANRDLIMNNPAFARTRENMAEMTPRANLAKKVKAQLGQWAKPVVNRYLIGAINAALRIAQKRDENGVRGCKSIYLSLHKDVLNIPVYHNGKPLRDVMKCPFMVETSEDRKSVTVSLTGFVPKEQIKPPPDATHFKFCLTVGAVSDIVYNTTESKFIQTYFTRPATGNMEEIEGDWFPINTGPMGDLAFTIALTDVFQLEDDMTVLRIFGIVFGKMIDQVYPLKKECGSVEFLGAI